MSGWQTTQKKITSYVFKILSVLDYVYKIHQYIYKKMLCNQAMRRKQQHIVSISTYGLQLYQNNVEITG